MKYMMIVSTDKNSPAGLKYEAGEPPDERLIAAVGAHAKNLAKAGILLETGGLSPRNSGARISATKGTLTVTDGPFIETREIIGGYAILRASSKEEAIELGKTFMRLHLEALGGSYEGELEIRELADNACHAQSPESSATSSQI